MNNHLNFPYVAGDHALISLERLWLPEGSSQLLADLRKCPELTSRLNRPLEFRINFDYIDVHNAVRGCTVSFQQTM